MDIEVEDYEPFYYDYEDREWMLIEEENKKLIKLTGAPDIETAERWLKEADLGGE